VAPLQDLAGVYVPREVDEHVSGFKVLAEQRAHVLLGDLRAHVLHALGQHGLERLALVLEIHHGYVLGRHFEELEKHRQGALRHGAVAYEEDLVVEFFHFKFHRLFYNELRAK